MENTKLQGRIPVSLFGLVQLQTVYVLRLTVPFYDEN